MPRQRTRRLRKKLRVGEFAQYGFNVSFRLREDITLPEEARFWDDFIVSLVEANALTFGGGTNGFIVPESHASATDVDRDLVRCWLGQRTEVAAFEVGPLVNAY